MSKRKKTGKEVSIVRSSAAEYLTFVAASGSGGVEAVYADESIWLTQKMMGVLYDVNVRTVNEHLKKIFADSELQEDSVIRKFRITATKRFFATVQNKLHWAIHGQTAAEVIINRANADKQHMGLTTWKDAPQGKIQKFDVSVAKNYLSEEEMAQLARLVNAYLDVAEGMTLRKLPMTMQDWETRLNRFIAATDREILQDAGKVTAEIAQAHAESEFEKYRIVQDRLFESDFDRMLKQIETIQKPREGDE